MLASYSLSHTCIFLSHRSTDIDTQYSYQQLKVIQSFKSNWPILIMTLMKGFLVWSL